MLNRFHIKDYRCLRDVQGELTPLHAFIGPNDSGKSSILRALGDLVNQLGNRERAPLPNTGQPLVVGWFNRSSEGNVTRAQARYERDSSRWWLQFDDPGPNQLDRDEQAYELGGIGRSALIRLDPDQLRQPSSLLTEQEIGEFPQRRGHELAGVYDAILSRGDDTFQRISQQVRVLFPSVAGLRLDAIDSSRKVLGARLADGTVIRAEHMSEGLLYYLAYAALVEVNGASLLLVEEPENGLHPSRILEIMGLLRHLSERGTQVLIATHSPLVINELQPHEVSVVTRSVATGTCVTPIAGTQRFAERAEVYALGELWLSYANGVDEAPLLHGMAP